MSKYLSRYQVEASAAETLRAFSRETGQTVEAPIKIDLIGELLYDLRWEYDLIENVDQPTLAALYPKRRIVRLNEAFADRFTEVIGLDHFTKAHEIGHWRLHVAHPQLTTPALDSSTDGERVFCRNEEKNWTERQADWFAAGLLMPEELVIEAARRYERITWKVINQLSERFQVSREAMRIRLGRLGLAYVDEETGEIYRNRNEASGQQGLFPPT